MTTIQCRSRNAEHGARAVLVVLAMVLVPAPFAVRAGEAPHVTRYLAEQVTVQDESGKLLRRIPRAELPAGTAVTGVNARGGIGIRYHGDEIYLDPFDVELNVKSDAKTVCRALAISAPPDVKTGGSMGLGSGCEAR